MSHATVGFVYNEVCPLQCNFCCHTKEVVGPGRLTPSKIIPIIVRFSSEVSVKRFAFTGGDPFVYYTEIVAAVEACRSLQVRQPFHIVTSGYWAKTDAQVLNALTTLARLGMDALCLSYDREHASWVPSDRIEMIVRCARSVGLRVVIAGTFWKQEDRTEDLLPNIAVESGVKFSSHLVANIGRARQVYGPGRRYDLTNSQKERCGNPNYYDISIYPNGDVYPCCSGGFNKEGKLDCGNVFSDTAQTILSQAFGMFRARVAKEVGFERLYAKIAEVTPDLIPRLPRFEDVDSVCEVCSRLHGDKDLMAELKTAYDALEVEYVIEQVEQHGILKDNRCY